MTSVVVCGGAGFIGSQIADRFLADGAHVTVIDGLLPTTGGSIQHVAPQIQAGQAGTFVQQPIEEVAGLADLLRQADLVVDAIGWTRHTLALDDPLYDMRLNLGAHLHLLGALRTLPEADLPRLVYLGSRHQYGQPPDGQIDEETPFRPRDVQSVHKAAADQHLMQAARRGLAVASLRFGNTFGPRQPVEGSDVGLIGGFMREALADQTLTVYGGERRRDCVYSQDIAEAVARIAAREWSGYLPLHLVGHDLTISSLVESIVRLAGRGSVRQEPMPPHVQAMEVGLARFTSQNLERLIGPAPRTDLDVALAATLDDVRARLGSSPASPIGQPTPSSPVHACRQD